MAPSRIDTAVAEVLRRVVDGTYAVGSALPGEEALAAVLSVSRLTAREATRVLITRGVLSARQGSGTYVNDPADWQDLASLVALARHEGSEREIGLALLEVRRMIEVGSAGIAAARITPERLTAMESTLAALKDADAADDVEAATAADLAFHDHIIEATGNLFIHATFAPLRQELVMARRVTSAHHEVRAHAIAQHERILLALRLGSPDAAKAAMRAHMDQTTNDLLEYTT
ncbi:FadR/GntR family transcriptional regulator [Actinomyces sp.]|uniref:FadR/GntR family transcriptional regulator n=1 Tax=Actinomyces sp. TaxID=29317 RepID=UPI0026DB164B|nr:FCD domain-containing protein [Actinomyces sp.]MDO4901492.1 FCD domain-containing protein [Actinomyces sp.]